MTRAILAAALVLSSLPARGQLKTPEELERIRAADRPPPLKWPRAAFSLVPKIGFAAPVAGVPISLHGAIELAYAPPVLDRQLLFSIETSLTRPTWQSNSDQPFSYVIDVDELGAVALASFHWYPQSIGVGPYAGIGGGAVARRAVSTFAGDAQRSARELRPALVGVIGAEFQVGPGAIQVELRGQRAPSKTPVVDGSSVAPLAATAGYRFPL
jgi:hypothetical protein